MCRRDPGSNHSGDNCVAKNGMGIVCHRSRISVRPGILLCRDETIAFAIFVCDFESSQALVQGPSLSPSLDECAQWAPERRRTGAGFPAGHPGPEITGSTFIFQGAETGRPDIWELHLTPLPAGGSRPERPVRKVQSRRRVFRCLHNGSARQRRVAGSRQL